MTHSQHIVRDAWMRACAGDSVAHTLNPQAKRRTISLGDPAGLTRIGVHLNVVAKGDATTEEVRSLQRKGIGLAYDGRRKR